MILWPNLTEIEYDKVKCPGGNKCVPYAIVCIPKLLSLNYKSAILMHMSPVSASEIMDVITNLHFNLIWYIF